MCEKEQWYRIAECLANQQVGRISDEEMRELEAWRKASPENEVLYARWQAGDFLAESYGKFKRIDGTHAMKNMGNRIRRQRQRRVKVFLTRVSVAAVSLVAICSTFYLFHGQETDSAGQDAPITMIVNYQPILKLNDGTVVVLDSARGEFEEAGMVVRKAEGNTWAYLPGDSLKKADLVYNTLEVPQGAEFDLILEDGTHVWLNAASKLKYPVAFGSDKREVILEGEAYFEVTKDSRRPFRVQAKGQSVEVLGTEFNVDAYPGEEWVYTTLVNGSVKIETARDTLILKPGMQSVSGEGDFFTRKVNAADVVSWRHGMFVLEDQTLGEIMSKLARWYDFTVFYQNPSMKEIVFKGKIPRYASFETILDIMARTGEVKFNVERKTVTVYK